MRDELGGGQGLLALGADHVAVPLVPLLLDVFHEVAGEVVLGGALPAPARILHSMTLLRLHIRRIAQVKTHGGMEV